MRHGETALNAAGRLNSHRDEPLTNRGRDAVAQLALELSSVEFDAIVSSESTRARDTAAAITAAQRPPAPAVVTDPLLREVDFGDFEAMTRSEIRQSLLATDLEAWESGEAAGRAEPLPLAAERAHRVFASLPRQGTMLVVTHGVFARLLLAVAVLRLPPTAYRRLRLDNAAWALVTWELDFPRLAALNVKRRSA